jgi:ABC-type transporter Mla subunit MlaD
VAIEPRQKIEILSDGVTVGAAHPLPVTDPAVSVAQGTTTAAGLPGGTTVIDTARTEVDNFWNTMALLITSGAWSGQVKEITDWTLGTGTFIVAPGFGGQILAGVTYKILTNLPVSVDVAAIEAKLDDPGHGLEALKLLIDAVEGKLDDPATGLANLKALIDALEAKLDDPASGLAAMKLLIDAVEAKLDDPASGLANLKALIDAIEGKLDDPASGLANLKALIDAVEAKLDDAGHGLAALKTLIDAVEAKLDDPATGLAEIKAEVAAIDISGLVTKVDALEAKLDDAGHGLAALKTLIDAIEGKLDDPATGLPNLKTIIDALEAKLDDAGHGLAALKTLIDAVEGKLDDPAMGLANLKTLIDALEAKLDDAGHGLAALKTLIDAIEAKLDARLDAAISTRATPAQVLAQVQTEVGAFSGRTTLKTLLAILGWPDTVTAKTLAQILYISDTELLKDFIAKTGGTVLPAGTSLYDQILTRATPAQVLTQVQTEVGVFSTRLNLTTLLASLGIPDTAGKSLYTCLVTDRWDARLDAVRAARIDNLDATISSRSTLTQAQIISDTTPFLGANIGLIKTQTDKIPKVMSSMDFWGPVIEELQLGSALQANKALTGADVTIAGLPVGAVLVRVVVMFMCRSIENVNVAANNLQGAQNIQVNFAGGGFLSAIAFADNLFAVALSTREMGTAIVGAIDVKATVTGIGVCTFQIDAARADQDFLNFNDYQLGIRVFYTV